MKIVINTSEEHYKTLIEMKKRIGLQYMDEAEQYIVNGTPLPEDATNGNVIKAVFPNERVNVMCAYVFYGLNSFNRDWWNAPYKVESEDEE